MKEEDGSWVKDETLSYIYSASTDKKGKYSGSTQIASDIKEVWLYTDYLGAISPVKITISDNGEIKYNQADYIASLNTQTRGVTNSGHNYLDDWMLMQGLDWDKYATRLKARSACEGPSLSPGWRRYTCTTSSPSYLPVLLTGIVKVTCSPSLISDVFNEAFPYWKVV